MEIKVQVRQVYGTDTLYPACRTSAFFCALAGKRTITSEMVRLIRANGYEIKAEAPNLHFRHERHVAFAPTYFSER